MKKAEDMTNDICFYGVWQSEKQVDEGVSRLKDDKEIVKAMQAQLKFRKNFLNRNQGASFSIFQRNQMEANTRN